MPRVLLDLNISQDDVIGSVGDDNLVFECLADSNLSRHSRFQLDQLLVRWEQHGGFLHLHIFTVHLVRVPLLFSVFILVLVLCLHLSAHRNNCNAECCNDESHFCLLSVERLLAIKKSVLRICRYAISETANNVPTYFFLELAGVPSGAAGTAALHVGYALRDPLSESRIDLDTLL